VNLPDKICIRPLTVPVQAKISVPGSKSITNRALILAVLSPGTVRLNGALWAEDTELMVAALRKLGFEIEVTPDPYNDCNRTIKVQGQGGKIPVKEADLFVGTAGTAARFLSVLCALGQGRYRLHGTDRMHERPMKEVFVAIRSLGGTVEDTADHLPAIIRGPIRGGKISISESDSSQFASALILVSKVLAVEVQTPSSPYVQMTRELVKCWGSASSMEFDVEPDASSASYFKALPCLHPVSRDALVIEKWPAKSSQIDHAFQNFLPPPKEVSRKKDLGDSVLTLVITAAALKRPFRLFEAANLRNQECDRIAALKTELTKCGVPAQEKSDELILEPAEKFNPASIKTYKDHRMAMSFAIFGSIDAMKTGSSWITIEDPSCVNKTFPNFFETLESVARQSYEAAGQVHLPAIITPNGLPVLAI
jgi:3-phosphoshikimate 1-carboxyvinyltransferase